MQIEVNASVFGLGTATLAEALDAVEDAGFSSVELAVGSVGGGPLPIDVGRLLRDPGERRALLDAVGERGLSLASLVRSGNPLHPDARSRRLCRGVGARTIRLASLLGVGVVVESAGRPGHHAGARHANWVTGTFPADFEAVVRRQWDDFAIPFWRERVRFAAEHGVRIAIDLHPSYFIYDADGLLRLRAAAGESLGASLRPRRLFRQGLDPEAVARRLSSAVFHVAVVGEEGRGRGASMSQSPAFARALDRNGFHGPVAFDVEALLAPIPDGAVRGVRSAAEWAAAQDPESL